MVAPANIYGEDRALAEAVILGRLIQDELALEEEREAAEITVQAFHAGRSAAIVGNTEWDVLAAMQAECIKRGVSPAFPGIVTVDGQVLHQVPAGKELKPGDLLLVDFGAESKEGYASDVSRTWPIGGDLTTVQGEIYELISRVATAASSLLKPGARFLDIHLHASLELTRGLVELELLKGAPETLLERGAHSLFFPHGIGHLVGLDVHDMEDLGDLAGYANGRTRSTQFGLNALRLDRDLSPGMLVTIEPGFYSIPDLLNSEQHTKTFQDCLNQKNIGHFSQVKGIRLEDTHLITKTSTQNLTSKLPPM